MQIKLDIDLKLDFGLFSRKMAVVLIDWIFGPKMKFLACVGRMLIFGKYVDFWISCI